MSTFMEQYQIDGPLTHWLRLEDNRQRQNALTSGQFRPHVALQFERGRFAIKTADTLTELQSALRLRYQVFFGERGLDPNPLKIDLDAWDVSCDHLIVRDRLVNRVVGTYRLRASTFTDQFYSASEFDLARLLAAKGPKLELGRAAIAHDYRQGPVIQLLWRGIGTYLRAIEGRYIFGCASVPSTQRDTLEALFTTLQSLGFVSDEFGIAPAPAYRFDEFAEQPAPQERSFDGVPSLVQAYLRAGALIHGHPALDRDFGCSDFLAVLDRERVTERFERRYLA